MKRTNTFILVPNRQQEEQLTELATNCARLWNEITYERRQALYKHRKWKSYQEHLYKKYAPLVGSATAQQIINKNNEAWRSFFGLLEAKKKGRLPQNIKKIRPVGYWKDRRTGRYHMLILLRNDCYHIHGGKLQLRKDLKIKIHGSARWNGKQGRLEIHHSENKWRVYQAVSDIQPSQKPTGKKTCYIDLGVINLITCYVDGWRQPIAYSGKGILNQWWADTNKIAEYQSILNKNGQKQSGRLSRMYIKRKRRFRHAVNAMVRDMMKRLYTSGVSKIDLGNLKGIRDHNDASHRTNCMVHNFWSFDYIIQRITEVTEEYGLKVQKVSEYKTSSVCPRCRSENVFKHKRLFRCNDCKLEVHRDVVGVGNIASLNGGKANRVMTHPLLSRWETKSVNIWRTRISLL